MNRFKQPSTWAGLGAIFATVAPIVTPINPTAGWVISGLAALFGGVAVRVNEYPGNK